MTSAMTLSFGVSPDYKGSFKMETYVRKIKTSKSLGRVISSYNKRYLVLDLKRMMFYYLSDRNSAFGSGSDIPLDSITRMYIDTDATTYMKEDQSWLHGMTVLTTKKAFRFKFDSRQSLDNWLVAFNSIINLQSKLPIYAWPAPGTLPDEPEPNYFTSYKPENSKAPEAPKTNQENNNEEALTANRRDSSASAKKQPIFSPSDSDKVMKDFDSQEKHQPVIKAVKKKTSNPGSQNSVVSGSGSSSSEEIPSKSEIASIGKIKTPERVKRTEEEQPTRQETKNKEANLKEVDQNEDRQQQQQEQVNSAQNKAITKLPVDDLKISNDIEVSGNNTPKVDSQRAAGGMTPGNSFRHVRHGSLSRRNMATGGISMLDDMKKSSLESSKKNSWDEENSGEDKNKMTVARRPSNLLGGNKSALSRLSIRKDDEGAVKAAVGNLWKDNFSDAKESEKEKEQEQEQEQVREEPVKQAKKDNWDDWDNDDTEDNKPVKSGFKQANNEQTYNNKSAFSDFKPSNNISNAPTSESKKSLDGKKEEFHTEKKAVHNDWDDEW